MKGRGLSIPNLNFCLHKSQHQQEWGAGIVSDNTNTEENSTTTVNVLRLSEFILDTVATRELPKAENNKPWTREPTVLMKLDIEGVKYSAGRMVIWSSDIYGAT